MLLASLATVALAAPLGAVCSPLRARQEVDARQAPEVADLLAGTWKRYGPGEGYLEFRGETCVLFMEGRQTVFQVEYRPGRIVRTPCQRGEPIEEALLLSGDQMSLVQAGGRTAQYGRVRLAEVGGATSLEPLELGERAPTTEQVESIPRELEARVREVEVLRRRLQSLLASRASREALDPLRKRMREQNVENTAFLVGLVSELGWVDGERFGADARRYAFLIAQDSDDIRLMRAALPALKAEAPADPRAGSAYAYLYDRAQLATCGLQRYGTQLTISPDGTHYLERVEDLESIDELRAEYGLGSLGDYLDLYRSRGAKVVVGASSGGSEAVEVPGG